MTILWYIFVPVLVVGVVAVFMWARNHQPTSLESGVDAFQREMNALSPDAAPVRRKRSESQMPTEGEPEPGGGPGAQRGGAPQRSSGSSPGNSGARDADRRPPRRPGSQGPGSSGGGL